MYSTRTRPSLVFASVLVAGLGMSSVSHADDDITGLITEHAKSGNVTVLAKDSSYITVTMDDATKVRRVDGLRVRKVSSATLVPGLRVHIHGKFDTPQQFIATRFEFTTAALKMAQAIQAGVAPTDQRAVNNTENIQQHALLLQRQGQSLDRQGQSIESQKGLIDANAQKISATSGTLAATNARISDLSDFKTINSVTVYFNNNSWTISRSAKASLQQLAGQAKDVDGAMIQVQAYASAIGSETVNQRLSMQRADAVTAVLQQSGIPLTNVVVPAAMGTTEQVASNKTASGQAENRRAVVTLLQSKAVSGK